MAGVEEQQAAPLLGAKADDESVGTARPAGSNLAGGDIGLAQVPALAGVDEGESSGPQAVVHGFWLKLGVLIALIAADLGLNSSVENDDYLAVSDSSSKNILVLVFALQLVVQIVTFFSLFLMMTATYLFRVGLLGVLLSNFRLLLVIHPIYILITVISGAVRVSQLMGGTEIDALWRMQGFIILSSLHKLAAIVYYVVNLRAIIRLGDPIFYSKQHWVSLFYSNPTEHSASAGANISEGKK